MKTILVTGGSGFFGGILKREILERGDRVINVDIVKDEDQHPNLVSERVDIRNTAELNRIFGSEKIDGVIHCAAVLAHGAKSETDLWTSNVDGTRNVADACRAHNVRQLVDISSNCIWGEGIDRPIREDEPPNPIEIYGRSKLEAEKALAGYQDLNCVIIRPPTIIDRGRLGLLAILFEFIGEGRRLWTVGGGRNRYQFICAQDLTRACLLAVEYQGSEVFHIGSDNVKSIAELYEAVARRANSKSSVCSLPRKPAIAAMKVAYRLGISPLGPYHYKMIAENFSFDTSKIQRLLGWRSTRTNEEMLWRAYEYYAKNQQEIKSRRDVSDHRRPANMGVIRLLKWVS